jgi:hypothetical protein
VGDGYVSRAAREYYRFGLGSVDRDFCERVRCILARYVDNKMSIAKFKRKASFYNGKYIIPGEGWALSVYNHELACWLKRMTKNKKNIPPICYESLNHGKRFIEGLLDSEGCISKNVHRPDCKEGVYYSVVIAMSDADFMRKLRGLFLWCGIKVGPVTFSSTIPRFYINIRSMVEHGVSFHIKRKYDRQLHWNVTYGPDRYISKLARLTRWISS